MEALQPPEEKPDIAALLGLELMRLIFQEALAKSKGPKEAKAMVSDSANAILDSAQTYATTPRK